MGLKSFKSSAPPFHGINTKKVEFKLFTKVPLSKKFFEKTHYLLLHQLLAILPKIQGETIRSRGFILVQVNKSLKDLLLHESLFQLDGVLIAQQLEK